MDKELTEARKKMDAADEALLDAFLQRMAVSGEIGRLKREQGLPLEDPGREAEVIRRVSERSGEMAPYAEELYRCIFSLSKAYQQRGI